MIIILLFIVLSETVKISEYLFFIIVLSSIYLKSQMNDRVMYPTKLGFAVVLFGILALLMCFGIGNYNPLSVVKKSLR